MGDSQFQEDASEAVPDDPSQSKKTEVIDILYDRLCPTGVAENKRHIATRSDVVSAIEQRNANHPKEKSKLSTGNVANFLKDFIRVPSCNRNWPPRLAAARVTARQVYGNEQVFEFIRFRTGDALPFPDRYDPLSEMPIQLFETLSIPVEARALGRDDEPWLIQVAVSQRIVHAHLAIHASGAGLQIETLAHLQTSVKTQPEIDATFLATVRDFDGGRLRYYVTLEAKQRRERILEHQIREQVGKAFEFTAKLESPNEIDGVLPLALKVTDYGGTRGIYVVQFHAVSRTAFNAAFSKPEHLHEMPLEVQSRSFFVPRPEVAGISKRVARRRGKV